MPSAFSAVAHLGHKQSEGAAAVAAELFSVFDFGFVSRVHCTLQRDGSAVVLLEDRSSNGTFLNGVRVPRFVPTRVALGDVVVLGCNGITADTHVAVGGRCPTADPPSAVTLQLRDDTADGVDAQQQQRAERGSIAAASPPWSSPPPPPPPWLSFWRIHTRRGCDHSTCTPCCVA